MLRELGAGEAECARAVELLAPVQRDADPTGRPLFAANAALPPPAPPGGPRLGDTTDRPVVLGASRPTTR
ncbi:helix-turn-helix domain-containing protein [Nocardia brasiliensis]|uniref:helix-turn-helix domain-containing protein n=1 Tax=Nocardia brasiliensis TaxID=37326 RepID=UPI003D76C4A3